MKRFTPLIVLLVAGCSEYDVRGSKPEIAANNPEPELKITPKSHDFGMMQIPCDDTVEFTLENVGEGDLELSAIEFNGDSLFNLIDAPASDLVMAKGDTAKVTIQALPGEPLTDQFGSLIVSSNDPDGDKSADVSGAAEGRLVQESFTEPGIPPVDILFLIDQSCSMQALADDNIRQGMPDFITEIQNVADWQMIEVTKSNGCANGGILTPSTPNAAQLLSDNAFNAPLAGLYTEKLLQHAEKALSLTGPGQCNEGFLRQGASLFILVASDEAEQSQPLQSPSSTAQHWVSEFENYVVHPDYVTVSGIINLYSDDVCSDGNGGSPDGYIEAINLTGGTALDICQSGWGAQLSNIASSTVAGRRTYNLSEDAAQGTVIAYVNGVEATDYEFSDAANSVTINAPPINQGDLVEIRYGVLATCDGT